MQPEHWIAIAAIITSVINSVLPTIVKHWLTTPKTTRKKKADDDVAKELTASVKKVPFWIRGLSQAFIFGSVIAIGLEVGSPGQVDRLDVLRLILYCFLFLLALALSAVVRAVGFVFTVWHHVQFDLDKKPDHNIATPLEDTHML